MGEPRAPRRSVVRRSAATAESLLTELRAFCTYLARIHDRDVTAHLGLVGADRVVDLRVALADSKRYTSAKAITMAALAAGVDPSSPKEIERFMARYRHGVGMGGAGSPRPSGRTAASRNMRKAAKKARTKNRCGSSRAIVRLRFETTPQIDEDRADLVGEPRRGT